MFGINELSQRWLLKSINQSKQELGTWLEHWIKSNLNPKSVEPRALMEPDETILLFKWISTDKG